MTEAHDLDAASAAPAMSAQDAARMIANAIDVGADGTPIELVAATTVDSGSPLICLNLGDQLFHLTVGKVSRRRKGGRA